ncbi:MAG: BamA/TamA family outer membrane protein, partial [Gemmatimonadales bacterium]
QAVVRGTVPQSITVRIIGGNGTNTLLDSSRVAGHAQPTHFYDAGKVDNVRYGPYTLFDRRPQVHAPGGLSDPVRDFGGRTGPTAGLTINHDVGVMPRLGLAHYGYAFDHYPYASMVALEGRYSFKRGRYKVQLSTDNRLENSALHFTTLTRVSQLELIEFHGFGNSTPALDTAYFDVRQRQLLFQPAIALSLSHSTELSLGPVLTYSGIDNVPGRFVSDSHPYGFGRTGSFGEASVRLSLHHDNRVPSHHAHKGTVLDLGASYTPAVWDVDSAFEEVDAAGGIYLTLPVPTAPAFALRGGAKKVFGTFPFQDAAFLGGSGTIRTLDPDRYAGDAIVYGTAELRIPIFTVHILAPINVGLLGTVDYGRVYVKGVSDGGWHNAYGGGFWVGFRDLTADIRVMRADDIGRTAVLTMRAGIPGGPFQ